MNITFNRGHESRAVYLRITDGPARPKPYTSVAGKQYRIETLAISYRHDLDDRLGGSEWKVDSVVASGPDLKKNGQPALANSRERLYRWGGTDWQDIDWVADLVNAYKPTKGV